MKEHRSSTGVVKSFKRRIFRPVCLLPLPGKLWARFSEGRRPGRARNVSAGWFPPRQRRPAGL